MNTDKTVYPACVGLSRLGGYPNTVHTIWNDMSSSKPIAWYLRLIPMRFLTWDSKGVKVVWKKP